MYAQKAPVPGRPPRWGRRRDPWPHAACACLTHPAYHPVHPVAVAAAVTAAAAAAVAAAVAAHRLRVRMCAQMCVCARVILLFYARPQAGS